MPRCVCFSLVLCGGLAFACALGGCASSGGGADEGKYRTIPVEIGRDTVTAMRENEKGLELLAAGNLDAAAAAFERALSADLEYGPAHNNLGKVYFKRNLPNDWYRAAWEYEYAAKFLPQAGEPRNNLGLLLEATGKLDGAVESYRRAVELDKENVEYQANLARALVKRGDRTPELRGLLVNVTSRDQRPEWRAWAQRQLTSMGEPAP